MTATADSPSTDLVSAAKGIAEVLRRNAPEAEQLRRLPDESVEALYSAGIFGMAMPREWGGPETDPLTQVDVLEALARSDGSAAWCSMIGCDGGYASAHIEDSAGRELWKDINAATVYVLGPGGVAVKTEGGYVVSGQWPFASGSSHATVFGLNALEMGPAGAEVGPNGLPPLRLCLLERDQVNVLETWDPTGLRGTASNDVALRDVFVPESRTFVFPPSGEPTHPGPLYRYPMFVVGKMPAVPIGIAAGALEDFLKLAPAKNAFATTQKLADLGSIQSAVANAAVNIEMARAGVRQALGGIWETVQEGGEASPAQSGRMFGVVGLAFEIAAKATQEIYHMASRDGLSSKGVFDRRLRDVLTAQQHAIASKAIREAVGRVYLGRPSGTPLF